MHGARDPITHRLQHAARVAGGDESKNKTKSNGSENIAALTAPALSRITSRNSLYTHAELSSHGPYGMRRSVTCVSPSYETRDFTLVTAESQASLPGDKRIASYCEMYTTRYYS